MRQKVAATRGEEGSVSHIRDGLSLQRSEAIEAVEGSEPGCCGKVVGI